MIIGIGTDIIEIERVKKCCENPRFVDRVFTSSEKEYSFARLNYAQHLAARFASKEACMKAFGRGFSFQDIEVLNSSSGKPSLRLHGSALHMALKLGVKEVMISISHSRTTAIAFVLLAGDKDDKNCQL